MIEILVGMALAVAAQPGAPDTPPLPSMASTDTSAADDWLQLIDQQRWDESWSAAGTLFRSRMPQADWAAAIKPVRQPLGALASRGREAMTKVASLPGAPDGEYTIVVFRTSFANKRDAAETVVLAREASGWKVVGYFIN
jgi:hypothetical protein